MTEIDRILEVIDGGLQSSPDPSYGPIDRSTCWRCSHHPPETDSSSGLCPGCRTFLLGDGPDPKLDLPAVPIFTGADVEAIVRAFSELFESLRPTLERIAEVLVDVIERFRSIVDEIANLAPVKTKPAPRSGRKPAPVRDLRATEAAPRRPEIRRRTP